MTDYGMMAREWIVMCMRMFGCGTVLDGIETLQETAKGGEE